MALVQVRDLDFIERNGTWVLMMVTAVGACVSGLLVYVLKSRCTHIRCCGCECDRDVVEVGATTVETPETQNSSNSV